jgi:transposase
MLIKTVLNRVEEFKRFIVSRVIWGVVEGRDAIVVEIAARKNSKPLCSKCGNEASKNGFTTEKSNRFFQFVPLWGIPVFFSYRPRRVDCKIDGELVEKMPWVSGKSRLTNTYKVFLAQWGRRLSWQETARIFGVSWDSVVASIRYVVEYGLANRRLDSITQLGVDEISVLKGQNGYLTVVYQLDQGMRRLLWIGRDRKTETLARFFTWFGAERTSQVRFICSDMWKPYLKAIRENAAHVLHILDRFHIMLNMNKAVDNVRKSEMRKLGKKDAGKPLYRGRWSLLKRPENLTENQAAKLKDLLSTNLDSIKAYLLKEDFQRFWTMPSVPDAAIFLSSWRENVDETNLKPMHWIAKKLRVHEALIFNWFHARGELAMGAVEGLNLKAKLAIRRSYGFKSLDNVELALYHGLGQLPEPPTIHRFT